MYSMVCRSKPNNCYCDIDTLTCHVCTCDGKTPTWPTRHGGGTHKTNRSNPIIRSHKTHPPTSTCTKFPQRTTRLPFTTINNDLTTLTTLHGRCLLPIATGKQHHNMQDRPQLDQPHSDPTWNPGSIFFRRSMAQSTRLAFSTRCL